LHNIGHYYTETLADADIDGIHGAITLLAEAQNITTHISNPDFPRPLSITGTKAGASLTGNVVIYGTDAFTNPIEETIALNDNATVSGTKLFRTVTKITVPKRVSVGDTVKIGTVEKLVPLAADIDVILPARTLVKNVAVTVPNTAINITDNTITSTAHGFPNGECVKFTTTGTAPGGLVAGSCYFIVGTATDTFKLSLNFWWFCN